MATTCAGGGFFIQSLAQIVHLHTWWYHPRQLAHWWCFFFQPLAQILHWHSGNLHCVVVVYEIYVQVDLISAVDQF